MKRKTNLLWRKWIVLIAFSFLLPFTANAQNIIETEVANLPEGWGYSSGTFTLPGVHINENKQYTIPLVSSITLSEPILISSIAGCTEIIDANYHTVEIMSGTDNEIFVRVDTVCPLNQSSFIEFTITAIDGDNPDETHTINIPVLRDSAKVVLSLDISGSMGSTLDDGTTTRWQALNVAVQTLLQNLTMFNQDGDSLGLTYFTTNVIQPDVANFPSSFASIHIDSDGLFAGNRVINDITGRVPLSMTAMGKGLIDAKAKLLIDKELAPNTKRMVFLFTDGRQNISPLVNEDGVNLSDGSKLNENQLNPKDSVRYFVLATWDAGVTIETLLQIADTSGGATSYANPGTDLTTWFNQQLVNMLADGSPQVITNKEGISIADSLVYEFDLNKNVTKLAINLNSAQKDSLQIAVSQNDIDITSNSTSFSFGSIQSLQFSFPIININGIVQSGGKWKIVVKGNTQNKYHLSAIADDHYLKLNTKIDKNIYTVGDSMHFKADLNYLGKALESPNNKVQAIVFKPGDDLGNLLATYETPDFDSLVDMEANVSAKFQQLLANDSAFYNAILPGEQIVELTNDGGGHFSGIYTETELTGIYNILFLVKGETDGYGSFERTYIISSVFVFGQVVEEEPEIVDSLPIVDSTLTGSDPTHAGDTSINSGSQSNNNITVVRIRPKNKFGYYMGPGFNSKIKVSINKKPIKFYKVAKSQMVTNNREEAGKTEPYIAKIEDKLDGSYLIYLANVNAKDNPDINILVRGETLYEGKLIPMPIWLYIVIIILIILLALIRSGKINSKTLKVLVWLVLIILLLIYILQRFGIYYLV